MDHKNKTEIKNIKKSNWFKQHADTIVILGSFAMCFWTLNEKMNTGFKEIDGRFSVIEKDMAVIKTVLVMKDVMPKELAAKGQ